MITGSFNQNFDTFFILHMILGKWVRLKVNPFRLFQSLIIPNVFPKQKEATSTQ